MPVEADLGGLANRPWGENRGPLTDGIPRATALQPGQAPEGMVPGGTPGSSATVRPRNGNQLRRSAAIRQQFHNSVEGA